jgi:peptide-methionine (R)-S-oxide reductase
MNGKIKKTKEEWKNFLTSEEFHILREKGTERSFSGEYISNKKEGIYLCKGCKNKLFSSKEKYDSGSGWPSFTEPISNDNVKLKLDEDHGMNRTEVLCSLCGSHLGHVFDDGPAPKKLRFCINSASLHFEEKN